MGREEWDAEGRLNPSQVVAGLFTVHLLMAEPIYFGRMSGDGLELHQERVRLDVRKNFF